MYVTRTESSLFYGAFNNIPRTYHYNGHNLVEFPIGFYLSFVLRKCVNFIKLLIYGLGFGLWAFS